jgi:predicted ABC-type ATPase
MTQSGTEQPQKRMLILAGPNGAGKTTFAREFLPDKAQCPTFVNADLIAAGLSPFRPELAAMHAGRLMLELIGDLVARGEVSLSKPLWQTEGMFAASP